MIVLTPSPISAESHAAYKPLQNKWTLLAFFSECSPIPRKKWKGGKFKKKNHHNITLSLERAREALKGFSFPAPALPSSQLLPHPLLSWIIPKSPADPGEQHWPPYTQFVLYQNFSITLLCTDINLILSTASHKNLNASHIYGLPPSKTCQSWTATEYPTLNSHLFLFSSPQKPKQLLLQQFWADQKQTPHGAEHCTAPIDAVLWVQNAGEPLQVGM